MTFIRIIWRKRVEINKPVEKKEVEVKETPKTVEKPAAEEKKEVKEEKKE